MPTVTLPKVAQYIKNVGKSVKLASIDYLSDAAPASSDFIETNQELFKEIYSATINYKTTIKRANRALKASKIYEAYDQGKKALFEDLKTGNFYNKEREEALGMRGLDMDMDDMDFDPSMMDFSDNDSSDAARQSRAFDRSIEASTKAQAAITAQSADLVATTIKAGNTASFVQNEKILTSLNTGMANIHAAVSGLGKYMEGPMMSHLQNTKVFQENSLKYQEQITKQLDEMLEMQRNLYGLNQQQVAANGNPLEEIISYEGSPDLKVYAKQVYKNFKTILGPEVDMIFGDSFGKNANPLLTFVGSPLKVLPELLVKTIVPVTVKKVAEEFDKSVSGIFTSLIARFNSLADEDSGYSFAIQSLGKLFGIKLDRKTGVDTSKFKRGAVPFDGITRQTIVEVIPAHLRRIEAALTGQTERLYDMRSGKWTNIGAIEKEYKDRQHASVMMSFSEVTDKLNEYIKDLKESRNEESVKLAQSIEETFEKVAYKVYERGGDFKGYRFTKDPDTDEAMAPWDFYEVDQKAYMEMMKQLSYFDDKKTLTKDGRRNNRGNMAHLAKETMRQIDAWNNYLTGAENENSPILQLFNGAYKVNTNLGAKYNPDAPTAPITGYSNFLTSAVDDKNKNIFFYLQGIYGLMLARDKNGGYSTGPRIFTGAPTIPVTPEEALDAVIAASMGPVSKNVVNGEDEFDKNGLTPEQIKNKYKLDSLMKAQQGKDKKSNSEGTFIGEFKKAVNWGERFKVVKESIGALLEKPSEIITGIMDTADAKIYAMLFGKEDLEEAEKRFGKKPGGIMDRLIFRIEDSFDRLDDWFKEHVFDKVKKWMDDAGITEKYNKAKDWVKDKIHWNEVKDAFKSKFGFAKNQVTGAFRGVKNDVNNSYYFRRRRAINEMAADMEGVGDLYRAANQTIQEQDFSNLMDVWGTPDPEYDETDFAASGKFITKRGLAVVSPGETIIPATFSKLGQKRQLAKEKAYARRFGIKGANYYAEGTDSPNGMAQMASTKDSEAVKKTIKQVAKEISPGSSIVDVAVNSLIGGGVSLITGLVGGPLLGAAVGAGVGVVKQSQTARDFLFGTETTDKDGNVIEKKGLISKNFQKKFEKYFPDMKNYGIVGAIAGLFTPLGLVGGLMAGGAMGFLKQNDKFQEYLFGPKDEKTGERDGGLISKAFKEKVSKAVPRMAVGAVGAALLGPFGIIGNAALGSALGFVSTTDTFHKFIFGEEDETGKKKGGVVQAINEGMVKPLIAWGKQMISDGKKFLQEKILKPLQDFMSPFAQMIKNAVTGVADKVKEGFEAKVITPISDFLHHKILEPIGRTLGKIIKAPIALAKGIVSAPFQLLGGIGNNIRATQIGKGTATDMTAAQRMEWRNQHQNRRTINNILGRDKFGGIDRMLTRNFEGEEGLNKMKEARDNMALYLDSRKEFNNRVAQLQQKLINEVSNILNESVMEDPDTGNTVSAYTYVRYKSVQRINKLISQGKLEEVADELNTGRFREVPAEIKERLMATIREIGKPIYDAIERQKNASEYNKRFESRITKITGGKLKGRKDIRAFKNILDKEISTRENISKEEKDAAERKSIAEQQTDKMGKFLDKQTVEIVTVLKQIRNSLNPELQKEEDRKTAEEQEQKELNTSGFGEFDDENDVGKIPETKWEMTKRLAKGYLDDNRDTRRLGWRMLGRDRRNLTHSLKNTVGILKEHAALGWQKGQEEEAEKFNDTKDSREAWRKMNEKRDANGEDRIKWRDVKKFNKENNTKPSYIQEQAGLAAMGAKDAVQSIGGMLVGSKNKIAAMANKAYHMVSSGGKFGIADSDGTLLKTEASRDIEKAQEEESAYKKKTAEALTDMSKGIMGSVTGILGAGWQKVKDAKSSLFDKVNDIIDSTGPVGKVIKAIFGIGKVALGASLVGHFAGFWTESIWNPVIKPFWNDTLKPVLTNIGTSIKEFIDKNFPSLSAPLDSIKETLGNLVKDPIATLGDFFVDGLKKFWDYIVVDLYELMRNAFKGTSLADFKAERERRSQESQAVDENGNLLYLDADGNTTTDSSKAVSAKMTTTAVDVKKYENTFANKITNHGIKEERTAKNKAGYTFRYIEYYSGTVSIQNTDTGAWITLHNGIGSKTLDVGWRVDEDGSPLVLDSGASLGDVIPIGIQAAVTGAICGGIIAAAGIGGAVAGGKIGASTGAALGSFVPGIGNVIGAVAGAAIGVAAGLIIYNIGSKNGYAVSEEGIPCDSIDGIKLLTSFGVSGSSWPSFPVNGSTSTIEVLEDGTIQGPATKSEKMAYDTNQIAELNNSKSGSSRSGKGHIYQKAAGIANQKFGNSTIGEAGCGPVAATNLINKLGGNMDIGTAVSYAENGGFIDRRTGGATTDYISSILNDSGIGATETTNKDYVYNSLKRGNPVVMLGNSGRSRQTPFGANDHYITALGMDGRGNIITEDPDTPNGYAKFKASQVMRDMDVGIATGLGRSKSGLVRTARKKSGRGEYYVSYPKWLFRAINCLSQLTTVYAEIASSATGSMAIGKYYFTGQKARSLLNKVCVALGSYPPVYTFEEMKSKMGSDLYGWCMSGQGDVNRKIKSSAENDIIRKFLASSQGQDCQNQMALSTMQEYAKIIQGIDSTLTPTSNEDALIYLCCVLHCLNGDSTSIKSVISAAKTDGLTVESLHNKMIADKAITSKKLESQLEAFYAFLTGTEPVGTGTTKVSSETGGYTKAVEENDSGYTPQTKTGILAALGEGVKNIMTKIFGSGLMSIFGGSNSVDSSYGNTSYSGSTSSAVNNYFGSGNFSSITPTESAQQIWNYLKEQGYSDYGASGVMGCWQQESSNRADRLEADYLPDFPGFEKVLKDNSTLNDYALNYLFPKLRNSGINPNVNAYKGSDGNYYPGIGLAQWTGPRAYRLFKYAEGIGKDWRDLDGQLSFFSVEDAERGLKNKVNQATNPSEAARTVLDGYEMGEGYSYRNPSQYQLRANHAESIYKTYLGTDGEYTADELASGTGRSGTAGIASSARAQTSRGITSSNTTAYINSQKISNVNYRKSGRIGSTATVSYEDFLAIIIELLTIIAKNSDKMSEIINILAKSNINVSKEDLSTVGTSKSAQSKLKDAIRHSGLGRSGSSKSTGTPYGGAADERDPNDIQYVIGLMESLARS